MIATVTLVWPPSSLSGHAKGHWRGKASVTANHREWARLATLAADVPPMPDAGDVPIRFTFVPPDNRGDRTNYPNLLKPAIDGIADALTTESGKRFDDRRFLPAYEYRAPEKNARVEVVITLMEAL